MKTSLLASIIVVCLTPLAAAEPPANNGEAHYSALIQDSFARADLAIEPAPDGTETVFAFSDEHYSALIHNSFARALTPTRQAAPETEVGAEAETPALDLASSE